MFAILSAVVALNSVTLPLVADEPNEGPPEQQRQSNLKDELERAAQEKLSFNNLSRIGAEMLKFENVTNTLPAAFAADDDGKPLLSWRVALLPLLGQTDLAAQFKLDEPWDSEHNKKLIEKMPEIYKAPGSKAVDEFKTVYLTVRGKQTPFTGQNSIRLSSITDGTANTIMLVESSDERAVIWTKPDDFEPDVKNPIAGLVGLRHGGFFAVFCDGHLDTIPTDVDFDILKALFTRNGGEPVKASNLRAHSPPAAK